MAQYNELVPHRAYLTAAAAFGRYVRVKLSGSTANTIAVAGAADRAIGVTRQQVFTTDTQVDVISVGASGTIPMVASGAITVNSAIYGDAAGQVTSTANGNPIGFALTAAANAGDIIEVDVMPSLSGNSQKLFTSAAPSTAVANTTTETLFDQNFTIPANLLQAGDRLRIRGQGIATATNSTDTLTAKLYIGGLAGTAIASTGALDVSNGDAFYFDADLVIRTAGASGTLVASGMVTIGTPGTATVKQFVLASTAIDTTTAKVIGVSATWSVANAGDSCRLDILDIDRVPA